MGDNRLIRLDQKIIQIGKNQEEVGEVSRDQLLKAFNILLGTLIFSLGTMQLSELFEPVRNTQICVLEKPFVHNSVE